MPKTICNFTDHVAVGLAAEDPLGAAYVVVGAAVPTRVEPVDRPVWSYCVFLVEKDQLLLGSYCQVFHLFLYLFEGNNMII